MASTDKHDARVRVSLEPDDGDRLAGRVCVVTGANSGIGRETSRRLAESGATVVMVCRSKERGERAMAHVKKRTGSSLLELMHADLASFDSVRGFAAAYQENHDSLHVLVNNAGLARLSRSVTVDGHETTLQVNYLSHFLLTNLLLGLLKRSAPSRIINVSSVAHRGAHINFDDLQMEKGYGVMKAYGQSKLALILFTYELARRLEGTGVTVNCLHPGTVATNIWGNAMGPAAFLGKATRLFMKSPERGAETTVYLASSPEVRGTTGKYFDQMEEKRSSSASYDTEAARRLWDVSAGLVGLDQSGLAYLNAGVGAP